MTFYKSEYQKGQTMTQDKQAGFPWMLVIQVVLAIISFLLQRTSSPIERRQLYNMRDALVEGFPEVKDDGFN